MNQCHMYKTIQNLHRANIKPAQVFVRIMVVILQVYVNLIFMIFAKDFTNFPTILNS